MIATTSNGPEQARVISVDTVCFIVAKLPTHSTRTALYLFSSPLASDFLEEGLSISGLSYGNAASAQYDAIRSEL